MNSFAKSLVKHFCLVSTGLLGVASTAALADDGWLPNMVHYINNGTPLTTPVPSIIVPESNYSDSVSLDWPSFGGENYVYLLEYTVAGSNDWQVLYQGEQSYFESGEDFASGNYEFRIACSEFAGCPGGGYVFDSMEVVQKSGYVNAEFDHASASVRVYWGETQNNQGYLLEQSSDGGDSWQVIEPQSTEKVAYQGSDYNGELHTRTSVTISSDVVAQGAETANVLQKMKLAKRSLLKSTSGDVQTSIQASSGYQSGTSLQYRVKTCVKNFCGNSTLSKLLTIGELNPVLTDPGFETQQNLFTDNVGAEFSINTATPINGNYSLDLALSNYGIGFYNHDYNKIYGGNVSNYPILNGVTLSGKLRINSLSKGDVISVYPVAYYEGDDRRIEGQKQTFVSTDAGQEFDLFGRLWLDNTQGENSRIKRIYFNIRLLGSGQASVTLDDVQLYEGSGLAQTDPTLSSFMVDYDGLGIRLNWPPFLPTNARYELDYKEQKSASWNSLYRGADLEYTTSVSQPLASGVYQFRLNCDSPSIGSCPEDGYVRATSVVVREPEHITALINPVNSTTLIDWTDTPSAWGYVLQQSINGGSWTELTPVAGDPQLSYRAASGNYTGILHTQASKTLNFVATGNDRFRVKVCHYTRCGEWRTSSGVHNYDDKPMAVASFAADRTTINHGESVNMWWQRPANYSKDFTYTITATRPGETTIPWVDSLTGHAITRGGLTGIQRTGTQTLHIKACNTYGCTEAQNEVDLDIKVEGPPAAPWNFAVDKPVVGLGETVKLSWEMHQNYLLPVTYELFVKKPDRTGKDKIINYTGGEYFNRTINKVGEHVFYVRAYHATDGYSELSELTVNVGNIPVYQHSNNNLYLKVPQGNSEKLIELYHNGSDWQVNELTQAQWDSINPSSLLVSDYQVNMADYNNNGLEDFRVISADQSVQITVYSTGIFSIKTQLLGTPVSGGS